MLFKIWSAVILYKGFREYRRFKKLGQSGRGTVLDYGAVGDGVTNDTAAIRRAINYASCGTVYIPPGRFSIVSPITIGSNQTITGA